MKRTLLVATCIVACVGALAQGTVNFNNRVTADGIDAKVFDADNVTALAGTAYWAQLYGGVDEASLAPIGAALNFRTGTAAGYTVSSGVDTTRTITGIAPGGAAVVQVRAWEASGGATYEAAVASGKKYGKSEIVNLSATGNPAANPPILPVNLIGLQSFSLIPEPSTIALGVLGAAVLLLRRRK
ncbi:MAG: PEP-CTERM sorting domain-containing protein [Verrucomicrobia bacterium]|nr:PEP-CTERM sorting domain-containing protein [Verrucomicrobiota bacterium]